MQGFICCGDAIILGFESSWNPSILRLSVSGCGNELEGRLLERIASQSIILGTDIFLSLIHIYAFREPLLLPDYHPFTSS